MNYLSDAIGLDSTFGQRFGDWGDSPGVPGDLSALYGTGNPLTGANFGNSAAATSPAIGSQIGQPIDTKGWNLRGTIDPAGGPSGPDVNLDNVLLKTTIGMGDGGITLNTSAGGLFGNFLVRAGVVILGFVFVAVGLSKFGGEQVASVVRRASPL